MKLMLVKVWHRPGSSHLSDQMQLSSKSEEGKTPQKRKWQSEPYHHGSRRRFGFYCWIPEPDILPSAFALQLSGFHLSWLACRHLPVLLFFTTSNSNENLITPPISDEQATKSNRSIVKYDASVFPQAQSPSTPPQENYIKIYMKSQANFKKKKKIIWSVWRK